MESENKIQQTIVMWYRNNHCLKHHEPRCLIASIPNGGYRNHKEAMVLMATGVYKGFSDLIVVHRKTNEPATVLFIEVKTPSGVQSSDQIQFEHHVEALGLRYHIVRSLQEFKDLINGIQNNR